MRLPTWPCPSRPGIRVDPASGSNGAGPVIDSKFQESGGNTALAPWAVAGFSLAVSGYDPLARFAPKYKVKY
jgi:hypothetical protein